MPESDHTPSRSSIPWLCCAGALSASDASPSAGSNHNWHYSRVGCLSSAALPANVASVSLAASAHPAAAAHPALCAAGLTVAGVAATAALIHKTQVDAESAAREAAANGQSEEEQQRARDAAELMSCVQYGVILPAAAHAGFTAIAPDAAASAECQNELTALAFTQLGLLWSGMHTYQRIEAEQAREENPCLLLCLPSRERAAHTPPGAQTIEGRSNTDAAPHTVQPSAGYSALELTEAGPFAARNTQRRQTESAALLPGSR